MSKIIELDKLKHEVDLEINGIENIPKDYPCVIISNHNRLLDIFYLPLAFDKDIISLVSARLVYKKDTDRLYQLKKYLNAFPIEAHGGPIYSKIGLTQSAKFLEEGLDVSIFPEGAYIDDTEHVYKGRTGAARILFDSIENIGYAYLLPVSIDVKSNSDLDNYIPSPEDKVSICINEPINPDLYYRDFSKTDDLKEKNEILHQITDTGMKTIASSLGREYVDEYIKLRPKGNVILSNGDTIPTEQAQTECIIKRYDKDLKKLRLTLTKEISCNSRN